jgi:release factor glutamine methyltransferase
MISRAHLRGRYLATEDDLDLDALLRWGRDRLKSAGIDDHEISAEILLRDLFNFSRSELILQSNKRVDSNKIDDYRSLIEKRSEHIPLQYLIEFVEFYNIRLKCDRRALIPRPETEILVETVIERLKDKDSPKILDIGTGSGNIAISLAKNITDSKVTGIDISEEALELAEFNVALNDIRGRLNLLSGDIKDENFVKSLGRFDCVVSNPPYISEDEIDGLQPEVVEFEPRCALVSPGDPLGFFKVILESIPEILRPEGLLAFEVGLGQAQDVRDLMSGKFDMIELIKDLTGINRIVIGTYAGRDKI